MLVSTSIDVDSNVATISSWIRKKCKLKICFGRNYERFLRKKEVKLYLNTFERPCFSEILFSDLSVCTDGNLRKHWLKGGVLKADNPRQKVFVG